MASNIVDLIRDQLDDNFGQAATDATGLSVEETRRTVGDAVPALLAGILSSGATPTGANVLASALRTQDQNTLASLPSIMTGTNLQSLINLGLNILTSFFGEVKLAELIGALSKFGGINRSSVKSILGLLAPTVMGVLGQQQRAGGLDVDGLMRMLGAQKGNIAVAMPSNLATALRSTGLLDSLGGTIWTVAGTIAPASRATASGTGAAANTVEAVVGRGRTWGMLVAGWLALVLVGGGLTQILKTEPVQQAAQDATGAATQVASTAKSMVVGDVDVRQELRSITDGLTQTMADVRDPASAKAALPMLTEVGKKVEYLTPLVGKLSEAAKPAFVEMVKKTIASLQAETDRVASIEGVSDTIKPTMDVLKAKLEALAA